MVAAKALTRGSWWVPQFLTDRLSWKYIVYVSTKRDHRELQVTRSVRESICCVNIIYLYLFMKVKFEVGAV